VESLKVSGTLFWFDGDKPMMQQFAVTPVLHPDAAIGFKLVHQQATMMSEGKIIWNDDSVHAASNTTSLASSESKLDGKSELDEILKAEAKVSKNVVGPPFTIVRLTNKGGVWVESGDLCRKTS
jgi:hypothetical protein